MNKKTSDLIGKKVYDASASLIGTVTDVDLNSDKGFSIIISTRGTNPVGSSRDVVIEAKEIAIVKDAVLLKTTLELVQRLCTKCGYANPPVATYCRECGTRLNETEYPLIQQTAAKDQSNKRL